MHGAVGLSTEVGELVEACSQFLLTGRFNQEDRGPIFEEMGDIGYYLIVLAKTLKVKVPASSKKIMLKGTVSAAILALNGYSTLILSASKKSFYGIATAKDKYGVARVDAPVQDKTDLAQQEKMRMWVEEAILLFWALCPALTTHKPDVVFGGNIAKLSARYGAGKFDHSAALKPHNAKQQQDTAMSVLAPTKIKTKGVKNLQSIANKV
jgi:hypothetical protein